MSFQDERDDTLEDEFRAAVHRESEQQGFPPELDNIATVQQARALETEALGELAKTMARYCAFRAHRLALQMRSAN